MTIQYNTHGSSTSTGNSTMHAVGIHPLQFDAILCAVSSKRRSSRNSDNDDDLNEYQSDWTWRNSNSGTGEDEDHRHKNEEERHKNKGNAILQRLICEQYPMFFEDDEEEEEEFDQDQEEGENDDDDIVENLRAVRDVVPTTIFTTEASLPPLSSSSVTRRGKRSRNDNSRNRRNNDTTTTTSCTRTTAKAKAEETTKNSNSNSNKKMKIVNDIIQQFDGRFLKAIVCPQQRQTYSSFFVVNRNDVKALIAWKFYQLRRSSTTTTATDSIARSKNNNTIIVGNIDDDDEVKGRKKKRTTSSSSSIMINPTTSFETAVGYLSSPDASVAPGMDDEEDDLGIVIESEDDDDDDSIVVNCYYHSSTSNSSETTAIGGGGGGDVGVVAAASATKIGGNINYQETAAAVTTITPFQNEDEEMIIQRTNNDDTIQITTPCSSNTSTSSCSSSSSQTIATPRRELDYSVRTRSEEEMAVPASATATEQELDLKRTGIWSDHHVFEMKRITEINASLKNTMKNLQTKYNQMKQNEQSEIESAIAATRIEMEGKQESMMKYATTEIYSLQQSLNDKKLECDRLNEKEQIKNERIESLGRQLDGSQTMCTTIKLDELNNIESAIATTQKNMREEQQLLIETAVEEARGVARNEIDRLTKELEDAKKETAQEKKHSTILDSRACHLSKKMEDAKKETAQEKEHITSLHLQVKDADSLNASLQEQIQNQKEESDKMKLTNEELKSAQNQSFKILLEGVRSEMVKEKKINDFLKKQVRDLQTANERKTRDHEVNKTNAIYVARSAAIAEQQLKMDKIEEMARTTQHDIKTNAEAKAKQDISKIKEDYQSKMDSLEERLKKEQEKCEKMTEKIAEEETGRATSKIEHDFLQNKLQNYVKKCRKITAENTNAVVYREYAISEAKRLQSEMSSLKIECKKITAGKATAEATNFKISNENSAREEQIKELQVKYDKCVLETKQVKVDHQQLMTENAALTDKVESLDQTRTEFTSQLQNQREIHRLRLDALTVELESLRRTKVELTNQLQNHQQLITENAALTVERGSLVRTRNELRIQLQNQESLKNAADEKAELAQNKVDILQKEQEKSQSLREELKDMEAEKMKVEENYQSQTRNQQQLFKDAAEKALIELNNWKKSKDAADKNIEAVQQKFDSLQKNHDDMKNEALAQMEANSQINKNHTLAMEGLQISKNAADKKAEELQTKNESLQQVHDDMMKGAERKDETAFNENQLLKSSKNAADEKATKLQNALDILQKNHEEMKKGAERKHETALNENQLLESSKNAADEKATKLQNTLDILQKNHEDMKRAHENELRAIEEKEQNQLRDLQLELKEAKEKAEINLDRLMSDNNTRRLSDDTSDLTMTGDNFPAGSNPENALKMVTDRRNEVTIREESEQRQPVMVSTAISNSEGQQSSNDNDSRDDTASTLTGERNLSSNDVTSSDDTAATSTSKDETRRITNEFVAEEQVVVSMVEAIGSPYEGQECAEVGEILFDEWKNLIEPTALNPNLIRLMGDPIARSLHEANIEIRKSNILFHKSWVNGIIGGRQLGKIFKRQLLLCLHSHRLADADTVQLQAVITNLDCFELVIDALKAYKLKSDFPNLALYRYENANGRAFYFESEKERSFKCLIFVARGYSAILNMKFTDDFTLSLKKNIKDCLAIMDKNVRKLNGPSANTSKVTNRRPSSSKSKAASSKGQKRHADTSALNDGMSQELAVANGRPQKRIRNHSSNPESLLMSFQMLEDQQQRIKSMIDFYRIRLYSHRDSLIISGQSNGMIAKPVIRRLARCGGIKRVAGLSYEESDDDDDDAAVDIINEGETAIKDKCKPEIMDRKIIDVMMGFQLENNFNVTATDVASLLGCHERTKSFRERWYELMNEKNYIGPSKTGEKGFQLTDEGLKYQTDEYEGMTSVDGDHQDRIKKGFKKKYSLVIFNFLDEYGSLTIDKLADLVGISKSTGNITYSLKELRENGYIEEDPDKDGKKKKYRLSNKSYLSNQNRLKDQSDVAFNNDDKGSSGVDGIDQTQTRSGRIVQNNYDNNFHYKRLRSTRLK